VTLPHDSTVTVATLNNLPAGSYLVLAKTTVVETDSSGGHGGVARCTVNGDPTANTPSDDYAETELGRGGNGAADRAPLPTQVTIDLASAGAVVLRCRWNDDKRSSPALARETKVTAVRVGSATRTPVSG